MLLVLSAANGKLYDLHQFGHGMFSQFKNVYENPNHVPRVEARNTGQQTSKEYNKYQAKIRDQCILITYVFIFRLCGLVVRVLGYRSGGPGSIPGTTRKK
jgi:hypothetical protein